MHLFVGLAAVPVVRVDARSAADQSGVLRQARQRAKQRGVVLVRVVLGERHEVAASQLEPFEAPHHLVLTQRAVHGRVGGQRRDVDPLRIGVEVGDHLPARGLAETEHPIGPVQRDLRASCSTSRWTPRGAHAIAHVVPEHVAEVRDRRLGWIEKTRAGVKDRLTKEITYWDHRAEQLKLKEQAGKAGARLNSQEARRRADDLQARLERRLAELDREARLSALPPLVLGGIVVVPLGLVTAMTGRAPKAPARPADTQASAARARAAVMEVERALGFEPTDREFERLGYDIESRVPGTGKLRFLEVKGRVTGADTVTVTKNEILTSLNKPDDFILALVEFQDDDRHRVRSLRRPFQREPDLGVTSVNDDFKELLARAEAPR